MIDLKGLKKIFEDVSDDVINLEKRIQALDTRINSFTAPLQKQRQQLQSLLLQKRRQQQIENDRNRAMQKSQQQTQTNAQQAANTNPSTNQNYGA